MQAFQTAASVHPLCGHTGCAFGITAFAVLPQRGIRMKVLPMQAFHTAASVYPLCGHTGCAFGKTAFAVLPQRGIKMKIGIIGAINAEVAYLKDQMTIERTVAIARMEFCEGVYGNTDVVVVQSGIGKVNAGLCVQILADRFGVTHVINTGIAGSLNNDLNIGDILVSVDAVYHDVDATVFGYKHGEVPQLGIWAFPADEKLRAQAVSAVAGAAPDVKAYEGRVASGDQFISDKALKEEIKKNTDADCVEMEGCAIAQACWINHIPFVIIRAISDKADGSDIQEYNTFESKAAEHCAHITGYMMAHLNMPGD